MAISLHIQLSVAAGVFRTTAGEYFLYGYYHQTDVSPTGVNVQSATVSQPGIFLGSSHTNVALPYIFNGTLTVKQPNTSALFSCDTRSSTFTITGCTHSFYSTFLQSTPSGSSLSVLAFR